MQDRHTNRKKYFKEQGITTAKYVIPYIKKFKKISPETKVLEIGCGEGGNLMPFVDLGCTCMGVDLNKKQIALAKSLYAEHENNHKVTFLDEDIYDTDLEKLGTYDLIIMRDVIEHIHDQERFFKFQKNLLKSDGLVFIGFPPWYMPFGGHQQICKSKFLSKLPYYHILPKPIYKSILKAFGEPDNRIEALLEIKETGISIERIRRIIRAEKYEVIDETIYMINPNYEIKFGLKPKKQLGLIKGIPFFRNVFSTCCYYLLKKS
jgi:SAM-dependent methyltransferase